MIKKFYDTCSLLQGFDNLENVVISSITLEELENIKTSANKDNDIKYRARQAVRAIKNQNPEIYLYESSNEGVVLDYHNNIHAETNDLMILRSCYDYMLTHTDDEVEFFTEDYLCLTFAKAYFGFKAKSVGDDGDFIYKGYKLIKGNTDEINAAMDNIDYSDWCINEYLIIENTDDGKTTEMRYDGEKFVNLKLPSSKYIKGKNSLQRCALDILNNQNITIGAVLGGMGSGKTFISMQMALYNVVEKGNQSKICIIREPMGEGSSVGYLKGTFEDKTDNFFLPLAQQLNGGEYELESLKQRGTIESFIPYYCKGLTFNQSIVLVDEAEDLSMKQMRLIGTRLGENSRIFLNGDYKQSVLNMTHTNALVKLCSTLKGNPMFACIYLDEDVRSDTSQLFSKIFD